MMGTSDCFQTVSESVSYCSQPLEVTKEIPFLSIGVYFQYPPSHKSLKKRSHFSSKESGVQNSPYGKIKLQGQLQSTSGVQLASLFCRPLFPTRKYFPVCEIHLPTTVTARASLAPESSHSFNEHGSSLRGFLLLKLGFSRQHKASLNDCGLANRRGFGKCLIGQSSALP